MIKLSSDNQSRLYILEDLHVSIITSLLEGQNYDAQVFESVESLVLACEKTIPNIVIIDLEFGSIDRLALINTATCNCPIVGVSEKTDVKGRLASIRLGCSQLIAKPVVAAELFSTIDKLIGLQEAESYRVLIVDDDVVTMEYHAILLEQVGIEVKRLDAPLQCIEVMEEFRPDLVLLDVEMPDVSGIELSQVIRQYESYAYIPIIFVSAESNIERQQAAMQFGGEYFISKPVKPERFQVSISSRLKYARQTNRLHQNLNKTLLLSEQQRITLDEHAIVSIADINGDITYANEKFCQVSGFSRDELIGQNHRMLKSDIHNDEFFEDLWHTISSGEVWHGEICNINKQGDEYWVSSTIVPFMDIEDMPYQYVSVRTDITRLRESEQRLAMSQQFAGIGSWDWNLKTDSVYWSATAAPLFGYSDLNIDFDYEHFRQAVYPEDLQIIEAAISACIEREQDYNIEHRVIWPDGSVHWLHETGNIIKDNNGKARHMLGVVRDITLRKTIMEKLSHSEQLMRSQLDSMSEGMFGLDLHGRATFVNQAACAMLGYSQHELIDQSISDLILINELEDISESIFLQREHNLITETEFKCIDGDVIPVEYSSMPVLQNSEINGAVVTFKNISERKRNEAELLEAKEQAEKANKAKSQFLASMSHELRTPMNAIIGFGQLLELDLSSSMDEQQKDNVAEILSAGRHLLDLINEILDLSKIEAGQTQMLIEPVLLSEIMLDCINLISPLADNHGIEVILSQEGKQIEEIQSPDSEVILLADKMRLRQVFLNLLSNAVKYNSPEGKIKISCAVKSDASCTVDIEDTGQGISAEHLKNLFQPFNRFGFEDSNIEGTGIGLVITKSLIEKMGGKISCVSKPGQGTTFSVELNTLSEDNVMLSKQNKQPLEQQTVRKEPFNILYIEDNPANIRVMVQAFSKEKNLNLSTVHEPVLGLSIVAENKPDLVLLDINLPGMSGYAVLDELRKLFGEDYPIIAISANALASDIEKGMLAGVNEYIIKPIDYELLLESIHQLLKH